MDFLYYLEEKGVDTEEMEVRDVTKKSTFNLKDAIDLALHDILSEHSAFYDEITKFALFDFTKAITFTDLESEKCLKSLIESYKNDM